MGFDFSRYMVTRKPGDGHAVLSASGSERWLICPGSIRLSEGLTSQDNAAGIRGTHTHTLIQFILENPNSAALLHSDQSRKFKSFIGFDNRMLASAFVAITHVYKERALMLRQSGKTPLLHVEKKVHLDGVGYGTADVILYQPFGILHVMDYKNGTHLVHPENNNQGLYYAHAAADLYGWDFSDIWITIIQPNAPHSRGPIRTWKTNYKRLERAGRELIEGAKRTRMKDAPLVTGSHCFFCIAKSKCPAVQEKQGNQIMDRFKR